MHPHLVKLGGAVITDKAKEGHFRRTVAKRLLQEVAKAEAPTVLLHGAGSFGHPVAKRYNLGQTTGPVTDAQREGVSLTMAAVETLHAEMIALAAAVGLRPVSVPLHLDVVDHDGALEGVPVDRIQELLADGLTPVLHGTLVRVAGAGWRILSADELMAVLAEELEPRLAVFVTDVDGVLDDDGALLSEVGSASGVTTHREGDDVTGAMQGKVLQGLAMAELAPTLILNGLEKGRLEDALQGRPVTGTRLVAD